MTKPKEVKRVEAELRAYIEAGLEDGSLVLDEMNYGFYPGGINETVLVNLNRTCGVCLLGTAVRMAVDSGSEPRAVGFGSHKLLGAAALDIGFQAAAALEAGFMGVGDGTTMTYDKPWHRLGEWIRRDYYSSWEAGRSRPDEVPSVTNVYLPELLNRVDGARAR